MNVRKTERLILEFIVDELLPDEPLAADPLAGGEVDSLAVEQLVAFLEDRFGIRIEDEELVPANFSDVPALARFVELKREAVRR